MSRSGGHMCKAIICASVLSVACAPNLSEGEGARCSEAVACGAGLSCYRGFCLPEEAHAGARDDQDAAPPSTPDAGAPATTSKPAPDAGAHDAGPTPAADEDAAAPANLDSQTVEPRPAAP